MSRSYSFKVTTNGSALLADLIFLKAGLEITRVAVGSGTVPDGVDLKDVHTLYEYVAEGTVGSHSREGSRLDLTVQYSNGDPDHRAVPKFDLAEFIVYARRPETGEETDLLYATLGECRQPVPAWSEDRPGCVFNFPLVLVVSSEIEIRITAAPGLVTPDDLKAECVTYDPASSALGANDVQAAIDALKRIADAARVDIGDALAAAHAADTAASSARQAAATAQSAAAEAQSTADAAMAAASEGVRVVTGTYTGDGTSTKTITIGARPKAAIVYRRDPAYYSAGNVINARTFYTCVAAYFGNTADYVDNSGSFTTMRSYSVDDQSLTLSSTLGGAAGYACNSNGFRYAWVAFV